MRTCTWAPTTFQGTRIIEKDTKPLSVPSGERLIEVTTKLVKHYENLGVSDLLIAQRWWGTGQEIEGSSLDCLAMTALFAACTKSMNLITAIHPGFFNPTSIAKWAATIDNLTEGRWGINVTSGWNMQEFDMYGIDKLEHDERYQRSAEFIELLRGAWSNEVFNYEGQYYRADDLQLEPRPISNLEVFQGGQSDAAIELGAKHSDWMFLNGGSLERVSSIIGRVEEATRLTGRKVRFAMYAAPICRNTDEEAWEAIEDMLGRVDEDLVKKRKTRTSEAKGMWSDEEDPLSVLDTNEGYASRLIGSPKTILSRISEYRKLGIEMLHLSLQDQFFNESVLPELPEI